MRHGTTTIRATKTLDAQADHDALQQAVLDFCCRPPQSNKFPGPDSSEADFVLRNRALVDRVVNELVESAQADFVHRNYVAHLSRAQTLVEKAVAELDGVVRSCASEVRNTVRTLNLTTRYPEDLDLARRFLAVQRELAFDIKGRIVSDADCQRAIPLLVNYRDIGSRMESSTGALAEVKREAIELRRNWEEQTLAAQHIRLEISRVEARVEYLRERGISDLGKFEKKLRGYHATLAGIEERQSAVAPELAAKAAALVQRFDDLCVDIRARFEPREIVVDEVRAFEMEQGSGEASRISPEVLREVELEIRAKLVCQLLGLHISDSRRVPSLQPDWLSGARRIADVMRRADNGDVGAAWERDLEFHKTRSIASILLQTVFGGESSTFDAGLRVKRRLPEILAGDEFSEARRLLGVCIDQLISRGAVREQGLRELGQAIVIEVNPFQLQ